MTQVSSEAPEQGAILPRPALRAADGRIIHSPPVLIRLPDLVESTPIPSPEQESPDEDDPSSSTDASRKRRRRRSRKKRQRDRTEEVSTEPSPVIRPPVQKSGSDIRYTAVLVAVSVGAVAGFVYVFFGNRGQEQEMPVGGHSPWHVAEDAPNVGPLNLDLGQQSTVRHDQSELARSAAQPSAAVGDAVTDSADETESFGVGLHDETEPRADFVAQHDAVEQSHGASHAPADGATGAAQAELSAAAQDELSAAVQNESPGTEADRNDLYSTVSAGAGAPSQEQFVPWRPGVPTTTAEAAAQLPVARIDDIDWPADYEDNFSTGLGRDAGNGNVVNGGWNSTGQSSAAPYTPTVSPTFPVSDPATWYYANPAVARRQSRIDTSYVPSTPHTGLPSTPFGTQPGAAQLQGIIQTPAN